MTYKEKYNLLLDAARKVGSTSYRYDDKVLKAILRELNIAIEKCEGWL